VTLFEKARFPRFHIGESLLPESLPILERIGVAEQLDAEGFPVKLGATFLLEDGSASTRIRFADALGEAGQARQVLRSRFDEILLRHAEASGVRVLEGTAADAVSIANDGVRVLDTRADVVVDASGRRGVVALPLGVRRPHRGLKKVAVYAHYARPVRPPGTREGDIVIISRRNMEWIWLIPLPGGCTSVGAVFDRSDHPADADPDAALRTRLSATPLLEGLVDDLEPTQPARFEADFAYDATRYAGRRWLLAGDAGAFLDPAFSTGVHLAVTSGYQAAQAILNRRHGAYHRAFSKRVRIYDRFAAGFYDPAFRDVLFAPAASPKLARAVTSVLAGAPPEGWGDRARVSLFHLVTRLQRRLPLVARSHSG
jgi:flavin-dependent dehydrogenase